MILVSLFLGGLQSSFCFVLGCFSPSTFLFNDFDSLERYSPVVIFRDHVSHRVGGLFGIHGTIHDRGEDSGHGR